MRTRMLRLLMGLAESHNQSMFALSLGGGKEKLICQPWPRSCGPGLSSFCSPGIAQKSTNIRLPG